MCAPVIKMGDICRTCLNEANITKSIFSMIDNTDNTNNDLTTVAEMLISCTSVQVIKGDGLPDQVCLQCLHYITQAFSFKRLCEQSDMALRERLNKPTVMSYIPQLVTCDDIKVTLEQKPIEIIDVNTETVANCDILKPSIINDTSINENTNTPNLNKKEKFTIQTQVVKKPTKKRIKGDTEQKYLCKLCTTCFTSWTDFKIHYDEHVTSLTCNICNRKFANSSNLRRHMYGHNSTKHHLCNICGKICIRRDYLVRHMRTHTGEKPFKCKLCGKAMADSGKLLEHMRAHADKKSFVCSICGKGFSRRTGLRLHQKTHSGIKSHVCKVCGKRLSGLNALKIHMKIHTGLRDFVCSHCGKGFTTRCNLVTHERTHTGERPYVCDICGKDFRYPSNLSAHSQSHNDKKQEPTCTKPKKKHT